MELRDSAHRVNNMYNIIVIGLLFALVLVVVLFDFFMSPGASDSPAETRDEHAELLKAHQEIGELQERIFKQVKEIHELNHTVETLTKDFENLRHQKISADVKLGAKAENLAAFLPYFPYQKETDDVRGLFNPIDLIVFRDEEIVLVEVKTGQSQLSEKQRNIKRLVKEGKVRFEIHRMDEKGIKVK